MSFFNPNSELRTEFQRFSGDIEIILGGMHQEITSFKKDVEFYLNKLKSTTKFYNNNQTELKIKSFLQQYDKLEKNDRDFKASLDLLNQKNDTFKSNFDLKFSELSKQLKRIDSQLNVNQLNLNKLTEEVELLKINENQLKNELNQLNIKFQEDLSGLRTDIEINKVILLNRLDKSEAGLSERIDVYVEKQNSINKKNNIYLIIFAVLLIISFIL